MADGAESAAASGGGGSKLMVALTGLNSLLLVGLVAVVLLRTGAHAGAKPSPEAEQPQSQESHGDGEKKGEAVAGGDGARAEKGEAGPHAPAAMLQLPDFVVHLRDPDTDRYARLTLNVELKAEKDKELINGRMPQVRDAFLAYLSDRSVEELRGSDGMALVKQDLAKKLNEIVPAAPVKALYVTEIVVQ